MKMKAEPFWGPSQEPSISPGDISSLGGGSLKVEDRQDTIDHERGQKSAISGTPNFTTPLAEKNGESFHFRTSAG